MKTYTLITGPTSGLGKALALQLAQQRQSLLLVARDTEKLQLLARELRAAGSPDVLTFVCHLERASEVEALLKQLDDASMRVSHAVLNAGFGLYGRFEETSLERELEMIDVNIRSVVMMSKWLVWHMQKHGGGRLLHIASLLSYLPFPYYSVYSATKSFVLAFSETLRAEMEDTKVTVLSLCPGPIDTAFNSEAMLTTNAYKANKPMPAEKVASIALRHLQEGKGNKHVGFNNWFISNLPRITPDSIMMKIKKQLASQRKV